jgi:hypothetical protein
MCGRKWQTTCYPPTISIGSDRLSAMELNIAIVCASLPFTKPLLRNTFPRLFRSWGSVSQGAGPRSDAPGFSQTDLNSKGREGL